MGVALIGFVPYLVVLMAGHRPVCALIHSRISPTRHAVMRSPSFTGLGKVPALTLRQKVAGENGKGTRRFGYLGSRTI